MQIVHHLGTRRVTAILFLSWLLIGMTQLVIPLHALALGASAGDLGLIVGALGVGGILLSIFSSTLSAYLGLRALIVVSFVLWAGAGVVCLLAPTFLWLAGAQFLIGLADVFLWIGGITYLSDLAPVGKQAEVQSWNSGIMGVGAAVGPILGGYIGQAAGFRSVFVLMIALGAVGLALTSRLPAPRRQPQRGPFLRHVVASHAEALTLMRTNGPTRVAVLVTLLGTMGWVTVGPSFYIAYLTRLGVSADVIGLLTTLRAGAGTMGRFGFAFFAGHIGVIVATFSGFVIGGLALATTPYLTAVPVLALVGSLGEAADRLRIPGIQTMIADGTEPSARALSFALISFSWALETAVMPPVLGVMAETLSLSAAFFIPGSVAVISAGGFFTWNRLRRRRQS